MDSGVGVWVLVLVEIPTRKSTWSPGLSWEEAEMRIDFEAKVGSLFAKTLEYAPVPAYEEKLR